MLATPAIVDCQVEAEGEAKEEAEGKEGKQNRIFTSYIIYQSKKYVVCTRGGRVVLMLSK